MRTPKDDKIDKLVLRIAVPLLIAGLVKGFIYVSQLLNQL